MRFKKIEIKHCTGFINCGLIFNGKNYSGSI
jgi:hypothetical protein